MNMTKMWVHAEADCFWLILPPFSGWLQKFRNTDIVSLASPRGILHKLVSRRDHLNISTMYSVIIQAGIFREYRNKCF